MEPGFRYQTFGARFLAGIVDSFVFIPMMIADAWILQPERPLAVLACWGVISTMSYSVYSVLMHAKYGQTLGKMVAKVKVLDYGESEVPGLKRALLRDSIYIAMMVCSEVWFLVLLFRDGFEAAYLNSNVTLLIGGVSIVWFVLEIVTMLTNRRRRALHDFIGGTVVVRVPYLQQSTQGVAPNRSLTATLVSKSSVRGSEDF